MGSKLSGDYNTSNGSASLFSNTTGSFSVAIGSEALYHNTTRSMLVAVGFKSLYNNGIGSTDTWHATGNTAIGTQSLYTNTIGADNTAIGAQSLYLNTTGYRNTASGHNSLYNNTTGIENTAQGRFSLLSNTSGNYNTAVGCESGSVASANNYCSFLGYDADNNSTTSRTNSMALGNVARITADNQVRVGNTSITSIGGYVGWTNLSDERFKDNIVENIPGISFIAKLRPVSFNLNISKLNQYLNIPDSITSNELQQNSISQKESIRYTGFLAQEVEQAAKSIGFDFSGVDAPKNDEDMYGLRYAEFVVPLVKAVQEQQDIITSQKEEIEILNKRIEEQNLINQELQSRLEKIELFMKNLIK